MIGKVDFSGLVFRYCTITNISPAIHEVLTATWGTDASSREGGVFFLFNSICSCFISFMVFSIVFRGEHPMLVGRQTEYCDFEVNQFAALLRGEVL